jgi:hypothetical protein
MQKGDEGRGQGGREQKGQKEGHKSRGKWEGRKKKKIKYFGRISITNFIKKFIFPPTPKRPLISERKKT